MTIHERIFSLRRAAGLSQEALAERVGVSRQAIGKWENGVSLPGLDNLQALAAALGVRCDALLTGEAGAPRQTEEPAAALTGEAGAPQQVREPGAGLETDAARPEGQPARQGGLTEAGMLALLDAYHTAQTRAARRQRVTLACVCAVLLALAGFGAFMGFRLRALDGRLEEVSRQMDGVDLRIDQQMGAMRAGIEERLSEQERIAAGYDWQYGAAEGDAVPLTLTATPKNRSVETTAAFSIAPTDGEAMTVPAEQRADGVFTARVLVPLTEEYESFSVLAAFTTDGATQTQELFRETEFYSARRTTAQLSLTDFRAEVRAPQTAQARLLVGGECALTVRRATAEAAALPLSATVTLLADGAAKASETLNLTEVFALPEPSPDGTAQSAAALDATFYVHFEQLALLVPRAGAVLEAVVTDSAGHTVTVRQQVYKP